MAARISILVLCLLAFFWGAVAKKHEKPAYSVLVAYEAGQVVDSPGGNFTSVTSYRTFAGQIYDQKTHKLLGYADGVATVVKSTPKYIIYVVEFSLVILKKGQITSYGYLDSSLAVNSYAITGGTGKFRGAGGELVFNFAPLPYSFKTSILEIETKIYLN